MRDQLQAIESRGKLGRRVGRPDLLVDGLAFAIVVMLSSATASVGMSNMGLAVLVAYVPWLLLTSAKTPGFAPLLLKQLVPLLLFLAYTITVGILSDSSVSNGYMSIAVVLIVLRSLQLFYSEASLHSFVKVLIYIILLQMVVVAAVTYFAFQADPYIARTLASGHDAATKRSSLDSLLLVGGYGFIYSLPPVILALGVYAKLVRRRGWLVILVAALFTTVLFLASYAIGVLLFVLGLGVTAAVYLVRPAVSTNAIRLRVVAFLAIALASARTIVAPLLVTLSEWENTSYTLSLRFLEVSGALTGTGGGESMTGRGNLYTDSFTAFLMYPFGAVVEFGDSRGIVGEHSAWFDSLGYFGVFGLLLIWFFVRTYRQTIDYVSPAMRPFFQIYWAYFAILGVVNTVFSYDLLLTWLLFLPLITIVLGDEVEQGVPGSHQCSADPSKKARPRP